MKEYWIVDPKAKTIEVMILGEADFDKKDFELIRDILGRLGLADVKEFGLSWEDCREYLHRPGHTAKVSIY